VTALTTDTLITPIAAGTPAAVHVKERALGWLALAVGIAFGFLLGASRVYEYYGDEHKFWAAPLSADIQASQ